MNFIFAKKKMNLMPKRTVFKPNILQIIPFAVRRGGLRGNRGKIAISEINKINHRIRNKRASSFEEYLQIFGEAAMNSFIKEKGLSVGEAFKRANELVIHIKYAGFLKSHGNQKNIMASIKRSEGKSHL